jgi:predicted protein tyrosine phosphatase
MADNTRGEMKRHPAIAVMGYSEAEMFLRTAGRPEVGAVLAIRGEQEFGVELEGVPRLELVFDDVPAPDRRDVLAWVQATARIREQAELGRRVRQATIEHVRQLVDFAREVKEVEGVVLCHCLGGISRSPAAALLCLAAWTEPGDEEYCADTVRQIRVAAQPHGDLIRMGEEVLERKGKLLEAWTKRWG